MVTQKTVVTFGEIMLRLATPGHLRFSQAHMYHASFGGGESNVAVSLAHFGIPTEFVTRFPDNPLADTAMMELRKHQVGTSFIQRGGSRLGVYFLETGAVARASNVIYDRDHSAIAEVRPGMIDWEQVFQRAGWFHWTGITPAISQGAADTCLEAIQCAQRMGITVSCDLNYRNKLWKYGRKSSDVMPGLVEGCDLILGNEEDAAQHFGIQTDHVDIVKSQTADAQAYLPVCRQLMERFPRAKKVGITLRGSISASHNSWSGLLYDGRHLYRSPVYGITHIVDRVGGGDSFAAGLIYSLLTGQSDQEALDFAVAASCLKHTIVGDANLASVEEVRKLMRGDGSGRVIR